MTIEDHEETIRAHTESANALELSLCERALNLIRDGFDAIGQTLTLEDERQSATIGLIALSYNSLRWAFELMRKGAYVQSISLSRGAWESWLAAAYFQFSPELTVADWREKRPSPKEMRKFVSEQTAAEAEIDGDALRLALRDLYSNYSDYSHPSARALDAIVRVQEDGTAWLRIGGEYDEPLLLQSTNAFCVAAIEVSSLFAYLIHESDSYMATRKILADQWRRWGEELVRRAAPQTSS